jgi:NADPH2:quinone reductase
LKGQFVEFTGPGAATLVDAEVGAPGAGEVLIEAETSLISPGTERHFLLKAPRYPIRPGYSLVGRVGAVGPGTGAFGVGDRVFAMAEHGNRVVCDQRLVFKVPETVSADEAVFASVGAMAVYAVGLTRIALGDPLLIIGQGLIGLLATQVSRCAGAMPIIGLDVRTDRLELSSRLGADLHFDAREEAAVDAAVAQLPGGGVAATIELSGAASALDRAVALTRRRGRIIAAALGMHGRPTDMFGLPFLKGLHLIGAYFNARPFRLDQSELSSPLNWPPRPYDGGEYSDNELATSSSDFMHFLRMLQLNRVNVEPLISEVVEMADAPALFERLAHSDFLGGLIRWR